MSKRLKSLVRLAVMIVLVSATDQPENKSGKKITVAVVQPQIISDDKADSSLGPVLAAFLIDELNKSPALKVIDLGMNDEVEKLLAFANSDKCDQTQCHIPIGNIIPAQKLVAGTLARLGKVYVLNVRLIDIEKNVVEFSAKEQMMGEKEDLVQLTQLVAIDVREHFGEKVEIPHSSARPQVSPASHSSQPSSADPLDSQNILGIVVEDGGGGPWREGGGVTVKSVLPDSACKKIFKPGASIYYMNPQGKVPGNVNNTSPFYIRGINDFRKQVASITPGASVGFMIFQGTFLSLHCVIPSQSQTTPQTPASPPPEKKKAKE